MISKKHLTDNINFFFDASFAIDKDGKVIAWNKAMEEMTGIKREEIINKDNYSYAVPFYGKPRPGLLEVFIKNNEDIYSYYRNLNIEKNKIIAETYSEFLNAGQGAHLWVVATPLYNENKELIGAIEFIRDISEIKQLETDLKKSNEKYRNLVEQLNEIIYEIDLNARVTYISPIIEHIAGYKPEEIIGHRFTDFVYHDDLEERMAQFQRVVTGVQDYTEYRMVTKIGNPVWIRTSAKHIMKNGKVVGLRGIICNINDRKKAEQNLQKSEEKFRALFENMQDGVIIYELLYDENNNAIDYKIIDANSAFEKQTGISHNKSINKKITELLNLENAPYLKEYEQVDKTNIPYTIETYCKLLNRHFKMDVFSIKSGQLAAVFEDISERKKTEEQIRHLSYHDNLTGLYNRSYFEKEFPNIDNATNLPISIITADLNGLKLLNDTFGHIIGDDLLKFGADIFKKVVRKDDIVARVGGDEFVILLSNTSQKAAEKIIDRIQAEFDNKQIKGIKLGISIGAATKTYENENIQQILALSEEKMYKNKLYESKKTRENIIQTLLEFLNNKNIESKEHCDRIAKLSVQIAKKLNLHKEQIEKLKLLATMHDIGNITIPESILNKPEKLTEKESEQIKKHVENGYKIASMAPEMSHIAEEILSHHERWDGLGYPRGLKGEEIPLLSRIIAVADAYDVMTNDTPYRKAMTKHQALEELSANAGTQFDPYIVEAFLK
ncbi:hypothetical protein SYNTR_1816 [Candidatus Syntrophocurvum alkaliphilum]|uniref:Uncharacterized protein n=1 Tax=Candidatus Syntrophocurvum alkaliphilum TaxID=2293317 RepID=A0A6I6DK92_9FIRM|nr:HD domain-containing phosphohydrolase [Candidatus Syntrophocurvum alkaliphilum]QGU00410.1 hypothetical protein SYNTR_1816 [Candidatus Syntrophocurvum alkaliphilum]